MTTTTDLYQIPEMPEAAQGSPVLEQEHLQHVLEEIDALSTADIAQAIGREELERRISALPEWSKFDTLATVNGVEMTPALMAKWAAFATEVARDRAHVKVIIGSDNAIKQERTYLQHVEAVARDYCNTLKGDARQKYTGKRY